jgi:tetratricopeptide (TPR) repeat protein
MADDDRRRRRDRFLRELASRDLYEWFGIPPDAGDDVIREAAERKRRELSGTPMPQKRRAMERAFCDQGEKALLRPDVRRDYDALLRGGRAAGTAAERGAARGVAEREARLRAARERIQRYGSDDARMAPGAATFLASPDVRAELEAERSAAGGIDSAEQALRTARQARASGRSTRALAHAERAHQLDPSPGALTVLAGARRDVGDLAGSETAVRESLRLLPTARENAPGWIALSATLRARGDLEGAAQAALRVIDEDEEDAHGWRALAMALADQGEALRAGDAWERSARLGLDVPGVLAGLQQLRKDSLARGERLPAADVEARISRLRER